MNRKQNNIQILIKSILFLIVLFIYIYVFRRVADAYEEDTSTRLFFILIESLCFVISSIVIANLFSIKSFVLNSYFYNLFITSNKSTKKKIIILSIVFSLYTVLAYRVYQISLILTVFWAAISLLILFCVFSFTFNYELNLVRRKGNFNQYLVFFSIFITLTFLLHLNAYPGYLTGDSNNQLQQVMTKSYVDWHPFAHTFIFFEVPMQLFGKIKASTYIAQFFMNSIAFSYLAYSFYLFGFSKKSVALIIGLIVLGINNNYNFFYLAKDSPFAAGLLMVTVSIMWIYYTEGKWLLNKWNIMLFTLSMFFVMYMRHNGIIAVVFTLLCLFISYKPLRKFFVTFSIIFIASYFIITGPIYNVLNIHSHPNSFAEAMGVPNNQICAIVKEGGDISEDEMEFIEAAFPIEGIYDFYDGDFNHVKYPYSTEDRHLYSDNYIEEHPAEYLTVWFNLVRKNFNIAVKNFLNLIYPYFDMNMIESYEYSVGFAFFFIVLSFTITIIKKSKKYLAFTPIIFNFIGSCMLLTGGEVKFIYGNLFVFIPLLIFTLMESKDEKQLKLK